MELELQSVPLPITLMMTTTSHSNWEHERVSVFTRLAFEEKQGLLTGSWYSTGCANVMVLNV